MDETQLCVCCLRCPPDKDLTPSADHAKTEIYSDMLQDCFNIQMVVDGWGTCGICFKCAGRLCDASDFKLQVQRCQAELRARTPARSRVKEEEPDTELPAEHEDETGYELVLQELPGPGLADGAGASDDEESTVKQEMITIDEGELWNIKPEPEWCEEASCVKEELPYSETTGAVSGGSEVAVLAGVSEAAMLAGLYDDHVVKDELVLGPERPHRPCVGSTPLVGAASAVSLRARRQLAAACAVRLERLRAPHKPARRASAPHTYACDMCTQRFNSKSVLIRHIGTHYRCEVCDKTFMMSACLTRHERNCTENKLMKYKLKRQVRVSQNSNTDQKPFHCSQCVYKCSKKCNLQKHQSIHTGEKPVECGYCDFNCSNKSSLRKHQRIHTGEKPFECGYCDFKCRYKSILQRHQRIHTGEKPFECGYCDYKSGNKQTLQTHQRIHTGEKPFECGYCDFKCSYQSRLRKHQRIHTGEKPFECGYCDYKSGNKHNLQMHQRTHTGEKPFECGYCDYKSGNKYTLQTHQRIHTGEKPFECGYCDFKCNYKSSLRKHQRIHTGEKPFQCGYCDYKSSDDRSLRTHQRIHTGEKPFVCGLCDFKFSYKHTLRKHQRLHPGEKPFECGYCDFKCCAKSSVQRHQMVHTQVIIATTSVIKKQTYECTK